MPVSCRQIHAARCASANDSSEASGVATMTEPWRTRIIEHCPRTISQRRSVMPIRDLRPGHPEEWSERNQTLRHAGEKRVRDDDALLQDPTDYSVVGGPDDERIYGHTRSDNGHYPW